MFAIFQRLPNRDAYPGNRTGLAPRRKIAEFHGETVGIEPEDRSGARFVLAPPAYSAAAAAVGPSGAAA